jgi:hypothetical protein
LAPRVTFCRIGSALILRGEALPLAEKADVQVEPIVGSLPGAGRSVLTSSKIAPMWSLTELGEVVLVFRSYQSGKMYFLKSATNTLVKGCIDYETIPQRTFDPDFRGSGDHLNAHPINT